MSSETKRTLGMLGSLGLATVGGMYGSLYPFGDYLRQSNDIFSIILASCFSVIAGGAAGCLATIVYSNLYDKYVKK